MIAVFRFEFSLVDGNRIRQEAQAFDGGLLPFRCFPEIDKPAVNGCGGDTSTLRDLLLRGFWVNRFNGKDLRVSLVELARFCLAPLFSLTWHNFPAPSRRLLRLCKGYSKVKSNTLPFLWFTLPFLSALPSKIGDMTTGIAGKIGEDLGPSPPVRERQRHALERVEQYRCRLFSG